jgi:hypothetical protein
MSIVSFFRTNYHAIKIKNYNQLFINWFNFTIAINVLINIFYKAVYVSNPSLLKPIE